MYVSPGITHTGTGINSLPPATKFPLMQPITQHLYRMAEQQQSRSRSERVT